MFHSPGCHKDVPRLTRNILVEWYEMDIANFVAKCSNCQQVKVEHQRWGGLTQNIDICTLKWEDINMDFIVALSRTGKQHDCLRVIVDRSIKSSHFLVVKVTYLVEDYAKLYLIEIVRLYGPHYPSFWIEVLNLTPIF